MTLHRTHILLETEQHKSLSEIARREGRSISDRSHQLKVSWIHWVGE
jgi:hypothetical protein